MVNMALPTRPGKAAVGAGGGREGGQLRFRVIGARRPIDGYMARGEAKNSSLS